jgi:predicted nuclease with RNAse H fold
VTRWIGVDVGGKRKGFDVAVVEDRALVALAGGLGRRAVAGLVETHRPALVAIDSPCRCAPRGHTSRDCERRLAAAVCGIRWTPDAKRVQAGGYFGWIVEGLALYKLLAERDVAVIEVFPTASWTRWLGKRGTRSRSSWSREGLASLGLEGIPSRTNQDQRDAIAAAATARLCTAGATEAIGEIVVPLASDLPARQRCAAIDAPAGESEVTTDGFQPARKRSLAPAVIGIEHR